MDAPKSPADYLNDAADLIEKYGWHQFDFGDETVGYCVLGAIRKAVPLDRVRYARRVLDAYAEIDARVKQDAAVWNDTPGRTKEEVLAALRGEDVVLQNQ